MKKVVIGCERFGPWRAPRKLPTTPPAVVRPHPRVKHWVLVTHGPRTFLAAAGRAGVVTLKREGDGGTPRARVRPVAHLTRMRARSPLPLRRVTARDGWCDDPRSALYNQGVRRPFPAGHEQLWRGDHVYDHLIVTDHNARPRVRAAGSAIFIHVARSGYMPTAGCIAFDMADFRRGTVPLGEYIVGVHARRRAR